MKNVDKETVAGFGDEWQRFDETDLPEGEMKGLFASYFAVFPWASLPPDAVSADFGCGSGRWAKVVAPRAGHLDLVDSSAEELAVARRNLVDASNVTFHNASLDSIPLANGSLDFGYSLGVLHHIPE